MMLSNASLELFYRLLLFQKRAIFLINNLSVQKKPGILCTSLQ